MKREAVIDQVKKLWPIVVVIFIFGGSWATATYQIRELERRLEKLEKLAETIPDLKADLKALTRERWRRSEPAPERTPN